MAEKTTIARPYAQAVFELARGRDELGRWSTMLRLAAAVVAHESVRGLIGNPRVSKQKLAELVLAVGGERFTKEAQNLVRLLAENQRLGVLPEIAGLYEERRAEAERTMEAEVTSAFPVNEAQKQAIADALKKRLGREIKLTCKTDQSLVGGAIIRAGDMVMDGSVIGQLAKLRVALSR